MPNMKYIYIPFEQNNDDKKELLDFVKNWQKKACTIIINKVRPKTGMFSNDPTIDFTKISESNDEEYLKYLNKYPRLLSDNFSKGVQGINYMNKYINQDIRSPTYNNGHDKLQEIPEDSVLYIFAHGIFQSQKIASSLGNLRTEMNVDVLNKNIGKSIIDQRIKTIKVFACNSGLTKSGMPDIKQGGIEKEEFSDLSFARHFSYLLQCDITVMGYTRPLGTNGPESVVFPHKKTGSNEAKGLLDAKEENRPSLHRVQFKNGQYIGNTRTLSTTSTTESTQNGDVKVVECSFDEYDSSTIFTKNLGYTG